MKENLRNSGIDIVGDVPWGTHFCQLYQTKEDLMDILLPYFKAGLENNEFCVWVTSELLDAEEAKDDLRRTVPDFDTYLENGQIEVIPYTQGYVKDGVLDSKKILNGWIEKTNQTLDSGYEGLRLSGNSFWLETHWEDFVRYEEEVDSVIGKYRMMALCTYSLDKCNLTGIADLVSNHQFVLAKKEGKWARIENSGRKRVEKEEIKLKETLENLEEMAEERTTQLDKAYNSLKESEGRLAEAQKMAHIGNWVWDIATDKEYWSDELHRIFKRDPQEAVPSYNEYLNYVHPDDRDYVGNAFKGTINGKPYEIDHRIILANGEERTVHIRAEVVFNDKNIPIQTKGIVQDITERKKAEEKIQNLANIVESSNDAIITKSLDGIITSWNKGAEAVYGYSAEEMIGKSASILAPPNLADESAKLVEQTKQGKKVQHYKTIRLRKDGKLIDVSLNHSPVFDIYGKMTGVSIISRDITESRIAEEKLRESEGKYRNIVETANEGILIIDDEAIVTYANKKMAEMLGYSLEEGIGRPIWNFICEENEAIVKLNLEKRRRGINENYELKLIRKDGSSLWVLINAKSLFDKDGKFTGSISMFTDITKRKEAEKALIKFEAARMKEIHHRIKNNLQVISSLLSLEAERFSDAKMLETLRESQNRVASMALIHEELYEGDKIDTFDFAAYLRKLTSELFSSYNVGNDNISLNLDLEQVYLGMDTAIPLGIIVNELVSNALKHAFPAGSKGEIQIRLRKAETPAANHDISDSGPCSMEKDSFDYILRVADNGKGMPEEIDFENADSLGLKLVNILVEQIDGYIELKRDHGTEFTIRFRNVTE